VEYRVLADEPQEAGQNLRLIKIEGRELCRDEHSVELRRDDGDRPLPSGQLAIDELTFAKTMQVRIGRLGTLDRLTPEQPTAGDEHACHFVVAISFDGDAIDSQFHHLAETYG
jgi:hypothetical protein